MKKLYILVLFAIAIFLVWSVWQIIDKPDSSPKPISIELHQLTDTTNPVIIFVHGIGGHPSSTWSNKDDQETFMQLLKNDAAFDNYVVTALEYDTRIFGTSDKISEVAKELAKHFDSTFSRHSQIIIVAHSMGGIVSRLALANSQLPDRAHQFVTLISLSSPFHGSRLPRATSGWETVGFTSQQLAALQSDSEVLHVAETSWNQLVDRCGSQIIQFAAYESQLLNGVPMLVVEKASATAGIPQDNIYEARGCDHHSIAKPTSLKEGVGQKVKEWILGSQSYRVIDSGPREISEDLVRPAGTRTVVRPGARLLFKDGAHLIVRGTLIAEGTPDNPIVFEFDRRDGATGNVLVQGPGANGTRFTHCEFHHGKGIGIVKPDPTERPDKSNEELFGGNELRLKDGRTLGGALAFVLCDRISVRDCTFRHNSAWQGGALVALGCTRLTLQDCRFEDNLSGFGGGAVFGQRSETFFYDCRFENNVTGPEYNDDEMCQFACGGAIYAGCAMSAKSRNCLFKRNKAANAGGAIYAFQTSLQEPVTSSLANCEFTANEADNSGGAIALEKKSQFTLHRLRFANNVAPQMANLFDTTDIDTEKEGEQTGVEMDDATQAALQNQADQDIPPASKLTAEKRPTIEFVPMENPDSYRPRRSQNIDTIVIHHISASGWQNSDFREQYSDEISKFEESLGLGDDVSLESIKYDWRFCKAILEFYGFSTHYLIDRKGQIFQFVQDQDVAFHAGRSIMPEPDERENVNEFSIGIEMISSHPDDDEGVRTGNVPAYTEEQYTALHELLVWLVLTLDINQGNIVGHEDIAGQRAVSKGIRVASNSKKDPGPMFDWDSVKSRLANALE